jgi:hypothetical protein
MEVTLLDPQLVHALQPEGALAQSVGHEDVRLPGFKDDGTPWTDAEVEAVWAGLRDEANRLTEIEAGLARDTASSGPDNSPLRRATYGSHGSQSGRRMLA